MIPKIIHYCWVGGDPLPEDVIYYIETWKKYCPNYEIIEWNTSNFDVYSNLYVAEAYAAKKWAFVSDYVRLYVLYNYGGIYLDTDVEILKSFDDFLTEPGFVGFESETMVGTAIIGSKKGNLWIKYLLSYYDNRHFLVNGEMDLTPNPVFITNMTREMYNIKQDNTLQFVESQFTLYPIDYFYPKNSWTGIILKTENTHAIHHFSASWCSEKHRRYKLERFKIITRHRYLEKYLNPSHPLYSLSTKVLEAMVILRIDGCSTLLRRTIQKYLQK